MLVTIVIPSGHVKLREIELEMQWVPRVGERLFFIADGQHMTGVVDDVAHWIEKTPHGIIISFDESSVHSDGPVTPDEEL